MERLKVSQKSSVKVYNSEQKSSTSSESENESSTDSEDSEVNKPQPLKEKVSKKR